MIAVEYTNIVHPEESALENVLAEGVLAVHPPGEVEQHFLEDALKEGVITLAGGRLLNFKDGLCGKGENGWIDAVEIPFIRRDLSVRMHVPLAEHQDDLVFRKLRVDRRLAGGGLDVAQDAGRMADQRYRLPGGEEGLDQLYGIRIFGQVPHRAVAAWIEDGIVVLLFHAFEAHRLVQ